MNTKEILAGNDSNNEKILLVLKQHPWYFWKFIVWVIVFFIATLVLYYLELEKFAYYLIIFALIFCAIYFIAIYYTWNKTIYIITNHRVISHIQEGLFAHNMQEVNLGNILFISHRITGPTNAVFNLGSVHIRASGVIEDELVFKNVASPYEVEQKIAQAQKKYTNTKADIAETEGENK